MKPVRSTLSASLVLFLAAFGTASCAEEEPAATELEPAAQSQAAEPQVAQAETGGTQATEPSGPTYREMIIGDPDAPVTIIEYASLTCSHCAAFHTSVLPKLKEAYIDTGKAKLVFRDFPLDGLAMAGAVIARCAPGERGEALISVMFRDQMSWIRAEQPIEPLRRYAQLAGMSASDVEACLQNEEIITKVRTVQTTASNQYQIQSTPTFFIGETKVEGNRGFEFMANIIDEQLGE